MKEWRIEMAKKSLTRRGLKIIVVGCGKVGETLTDQLTREGHEVTLIDKDPTKVHDLTNMYDVMGIVGTGASGLFAALHVPNDKKVLMLTKSDAENSDSFLAQGGICVLRDKNDFDSFMEDTMKAGHYENRKEL